MYAFLFDPAHAWVTAPLAMLVTAALLYVGLEAGRRRRLHRLVAAVGRELGLVVRSRSRAEGPVGDGVTVRLEVLTGHDAPGERSFTFVALGGLELILLAVRALWRAGRTLATGLARSGRPLGILRVTARPAAPPDLRARRARALPGRRPTLTGDPAFDARVEVSGPPLDLLAILTPTARAALAELVAAGGEVHDGEVRLDHAPGRAGRRSVRDRAELAVRAAAALARPADPVHVLTARAEVDGDDGVRCLEALLLHAPDHPRVEGLVDRALDEGGLDPAAALQGAARLRLAAVARLTRTGRGADVPALRALDAPPGSALAALVGRAVTAIQDRAGPEAAGRLTLGGAAGGELALAEPAERRPGTPDRT